MKPGHKVTDEELEGQNAYDLAENAVRLFFRKGERGYVLEEIRFK
jgi:hypothetical protein